MKIEAVKDNSAARNNAALRDASKNGHLAVVEALLKIVSVKDKVALINAIKNGHTDIAMMLLDIPSVSKMVLDNYDTVLLEALKLKDYKL